MDTTFDIEVNYLGIKEEDRIIFNQAIAKWEAIITEDIPDFRGIDDMALTISLISNIGNDYAQASLTEGYERAGGNSTAP